MVASHIARTLLINVSDALQQVRYTYIFIQNWIISDIFSFYLKSIITMREGNGRPVITEHDLLTKNSVYYYLFLGRLSKSSVGTQAMMESDIFLR